VRAVEEALVSDWTVETLLVTRDFFSDPQRRELLQQAGRKNTSSYQIADQDLQKVSDTVHSQGIIAVVRQKSYDMNIFDRFDHRSIVVALDGITDPGNMGTIIRTCDWFGVGAILAGKGGVELFNPKVVRSTMGSIFHVPMIFDIDLVSTLGDLKRKGYHIYSTAVQRGEGVTRIEWKGRSVIVFGNETRGISAGIMRIVDGTFTIPRFGAAESLNVGIACGVVLGLVRMEVLDKV